MNINEHKSRTVQTAMPDTFRSARRRSNVRANIFAFECIVVLATFVWAMHRRLATTAPTRFVVLASMGIVYFARLNFMSRYLLQRELAVEELTVVILVWLPSILCSFVYFSSMDDDLPISQIIILLGFYLLGSFLNTYSEYQRKKWKQHPQSNGRCYTAGLFSLSRNINYCGDVVLFAAWAGATGYWINAWAPILMALTFWFHHIPDKEIYLAKRYGRDWDEYLEQTPYAFIPCVC